MNTFQRLVRRDVLPGVLHPAVRVPSQTDLERVAERWREHFAPDLADFLGGGPVFLSINRFERKKVHQRQGGRGCLGCSRMQESSASFKGCAGQRSLAVACAA